MSEEVQATDEFEIICDTREQRPPPFPPGVRLKRLGLGEGDYTTEQLRGYAVIERKSLTDFASTLSWGRERWNRELERLAPYWQRCVVVEGDITQVYKITKMNRNSLLGSMASLYAKHDCPVLFAGDAEGAGRMIVGILKRWEDRIQSWAPQAVRAREAA